MLGVLGSRQIVYGVRGNATMKCAVLNDDPAQYVEHIIDPIRNNRPVLIGAANSQNAIPTGKGML